MNKSTLLIIFIIFLNLVWGCIFLFTHSLQSYTISALVAEKEYIPAHTEACTTFDIDGNMQIYTEFIPDEYYIHYTYDGGKAKASTGIKKINRDQYNAIIKGSIVPVEKFRWIKKEKQQP